MLLGLLAAVAVLTVTLTIVSVIGDDKKAEEPKDPQKPNNKGKNRNLKQIIPMSPIPVKAREGNRPQIIFNASAGNDGIKRNRKSPSRR